MSYICECANGKTWGGSNDACNDNASNCAQCCSGGYGGVASGMLAGGVGCGSCGPNDEADGDCSCVNCANGGQMCMPNNSNFIGKTLTEYKSGFRGKTLTAHSPGFRSKKIIGYGEDGKPHCKCDDGNIYMNCGDNCDCCDQVDNNRVYTPKSYTKYETTSCPCYFYAVKNQLGDLECERENFGAKNRVIPIKLTNHTINDKQPTVGDKWDCIDSRTCGKGTIKWDTLYIVSVKESTDNKFVSVIDSARSTSNCNIPSTTLDNYAENNVEGIYIDPNTVGGVDINTIEETINDLPLFKNRKQAEYWDIIKGGNTLKVSEYVDKNGVTKYIPGSYYPEKKLITSCYINNNEVLHENILQKWNYKTYSSKPGKLEIKALGGLLKIKIQGENKPMVDISIKDSSNRSLLKRKLKNVIINGEYILKQKIPTLVAGKTQETYNITITPTADTSYYYNSNFISTGVLKYTVWQFKNPTITLGYEGSITNTNVSQGGTTTVSGAANSFSSKTITATTTLTRHTTSHNYYLTKKALIFDDLVKVSDSNKIKKFITNQEDARELKCRDTITIAESAREDLTAQNDLEIGMNFTGKITKTKTVYKSIDLDEHLQEPCDDDEIFDILTNKFELENTTDLFSGMEVRGVNSENLEFITAIESVDCEKGITLESHYVIKKETILTFTHFVSAGVLEINKNNIKIVPCVKLPNNTEITFNKTHKPEVHGRILVDKNGSSGMVITTIIDNSYIGQDDVTFNLDLSEFVDINPPSSDQRLVCGKDDSIDFKFDFNSMSHNILDIVPTATSSPSNGVLTALKVPNARFLTYTPNTGFEGDDKFNFTLSDGVNTSDEKTIFIKVK